MPRDAHPPIRREWRHIVHPPAGTGSGATRCTRANSSRVAPHCTPATPYTRHTVHPPHRTLGPGATQSMRANSPRVGPTPYTRITRHWGRVPRAAALQFVEGGDTPYPAAPSAGIGCHALHARHLNRPLIGGVAREARQGHRITIGCDTRTLVAARPPVRSVCGHRTWPGLRGNPPLPCTTVAMSRGSWTADPRRATGLHGPEPTGWLPRGHSETGPQK